MFQTALPTQRDAPTNSFFFHCHQVLHLQLHRDLSEKVPQFSLKLLKVLMAHWVYYIEVWVVCCSCRNVYLQIHPTIQDIWWHYCLTITTVTAQYQFFHSDIYICICEIFSFESEKQSSNREFYWMRIFVLLYSSITLTYVLFDSNIYTDMYSYYEVRVYMCVYLFIHILIPIWSNSYRKIVNT